MAKPQPRRIASDDCIKTVDGVEYAVHEGEWVEMVGGVSVAEMRARQVLLEFGPKVAALEGEPDANVEFVRLFNEAYSTVIQGIARRLVDWNWTDDLGHPLPKPDGSPAPLAPLSPEEILYLLTVVTAEAPAERKND